MTGSSCPRWCIVDHAATSREDHMGKSCHISPEGTAGISALPVQHASSTDDTPYILLYTGTETLRVYVREASVVTAIINCLAGATRKQHRELAEGICRAARDISGEGGDEHD